MQPSSRGEDPVVLVATDNHLPSMAITREMVQDEDFTGHLVEVSDLKVKAVSHRHLGRVHLANQAGVIATKE